MTGRYPRLAAALGMLALAAAGATGCGSERKHVADLSKPPAPTELRTVKFRNRGMTIKVPLNWRLERRRAPTVFRLSSGEAQIAAFAYRREEPLPDGKEQLKEAEKRLIAHTRKRNLLWTHVRSRRLEVDGDPAIEVTGIQRISRQRLRTRSVHVFKNKAEYVFEALAPPGSSFRLTSRKVLTPILRSAKLTGTITARDRKEIRELKRKREAEERAREEEQQQQGTTPDGGTTPDEQTTQPDQGTQPQGTQTGTQPDQGTR